jgi:hypothetical protein
MFLDQLSVLVAIGFSGASLGLTFFMMWVIGRSEAHLLMWAIALALIVVGVVFFGAVVENYSSALLLTSFLFLIAGSDCCIPAAPASAPVTRTGRQQSPVLPLPSCLQQ